MQVVAHDDAVSILEYFDELEDPRSSINRQHLLGDLIVISVCGVLAGADGPKAIGVWARAHAEWLRQYLELPHGIPSHDTIGRLLAALRPAAFQACFEQWIASLRQGLDGGVENEVIAIDGKALRRSHNRKKSLGPLFLVSAWSVQRGISLGQLATEEKSNEITAIPELIDQIELNNATVTIDAAGCQKNIAAKIVDKGGDYLLALKGNQGTLYQAAMDWVISQMENDFSTTSVERYVETTKGHGREDTVEYFHLPVPKTLPGASLWKELRTIGVAVRTSLQDEKETTDIRFFISSLSLGVRRFAAACRRRQHGMAQTLRHQPPEAADRQRKYRHETPNGRMERRLPDANPGYQTHLVCVYPGNSPRWPTPTTSAWSGAISLFPGIVLTGFIFVGSRIN